jgi:hypothetical protein
VRKRRRGWTRRPTLIPNSTRFALTCAPSSTPRPANTVESTSPRITKPLHTAHHPRSQQRTRRTQTPSSLGSSPSWGTQVLDCSDGLPQCSDGPTHRTQDLADGRTHPLSHPLSHLLRARSGQEYAAIGFDSSMSSYFPSRSAPMGAVSAEVVKATFYNFDPSFVDRMIRRLAGDTIDGLAPAAEIARRAAEVACEHPEGRPLDGARHQHTHGSSTRVPSPRP